LAVLLIKAATNGAALNLNGGELTRGKDADIIALQLQELPKDLSQLPLQIILQTNNAKRVFVGGEE
jgi:cytosine/adenosine deaminase-related metal-dependent hydrolase